MNARSYKLILLLLSACVLAVLGLQGYWMRNLYLEKKEAFDRAVYASLDQMNEKLGERRNLQALKMTYIIQGSDTLVKTPSRNFKVESEALTRFSVSNKLVQTKEILSLKKPGGKGDSIHISGNSNKVDIHIGGKQAKVTVFKQGKLQGLERMITESTQLSKETDELTRLVDKMITEIKVLDTETENPDSLRSLIGGVLKNKGLFLPFEFSVQKLQNGKQETKLSSKDYKDNAFSYRSDLSANKIIANGDFLFLQFPGQNDFVLAGMKSSLILSFFFSLLIIGVFYYVMRLIRSQKRLSEIRNDFVNNMTHELKTPIATISLALDAISNPIVKNDEAKFSEYGRILKEENQKLNKHVERVLQIALLDKGKLGLLKEQVDLGALIEAALSSYKLQIAEQKAEVRYLPPAQKILFTGDAYHLQTVFANLLDNALKYASPDPHITIQLEREGNEIVVRVKDNGIGIAASEHKKIFERFYRVQGGDLHDVKGFGLGLGYVRSIVEAHHGTIELASEIGKGAEFTLRF